MGGWPQTITIIVALIACLTGFVTWQIQWLRGLLDARFGAFDDRFVSFEARIDTKFDGLEERLDAKIDGVAQRLDAKIDRVADGLDAKTDGLEERTDLRFDGVNARLDHLQSDMTILKRALIGQHREG